MPNPLKIILLPGLAANEQIFRNPIPQIPGIKVANWQVPEKEESLEHYCKRMAENWHIDEKTIIGGASFGGIIACQIAMYHKPKSVILIGSVPSRKYLPRRIRFLSPLRFLLPLFPLKLAQFLSGQFSALFTKAGFLTVSELLLQFSSSNPVVFKWSVDQILTGFLDTNLDCPVDRIHGANDRILPPKTFSNSRTSRLIQNAGHVPSLTHPKEIKRFIQDVIDREGKVIATS